MVKKMNSSGKMVNDQVRVVIPAWGKDKWWIWNQKAGCGCTGADFLERLAGKKGGPRHVLEGLHLEFVGESRTPEALFTSSNWVPLLAPGHTGRTAARTVARTADVAERSEAPPAKSRTAKARTARSPKEYTRRRSRSYEKEENYKETIAELRKALAFARKKRGQELRPSASRSRSRSRSPPKARTARTSKARNFGSYRPVKTGQGRGKGGEATVFREPANAPFRSRKTSKALLASARTAANAAIARLSRRAPRTSGVSQYKFGPSMTPSPSPARYNSSNSLDLNELRTRPGLTPVASLSPAAAVVAGRSEPVLGLPTAVPSENSEDLE